MFTTRKATHSADDQQRSPAGRTATTRRHRAHCRDAVRSTRVRQQPNAQSPRASAAKRDLPGDPALAPLVDAEREQFLKKRSSPARLSLASVELRPRPSSDPSLADRARDAKLATHDSPQWQGRGDSNSQPLVLETSALPIELHPCDSGSATAEGECSTTRRIAVRRPRLRSITYLRIFVTTPEPTVRPPSRMANRTPSSMAIGVISSTSSLTLSPGMHISASPSSLAVPVTSVVRK